MILANAGNFVRETDPAKFALHCTVHALHIGLHPFTPNTALSSLSDCLSHFTYNFSRIFERILKTWNSQRTALKRGSRRSHSSTKRKSLICCFIAFHQSRTFPSLNSRSWQNEDWQVSQRQSESVELHVVGLLLVVDLLVVSNFLWDFIGCSCWHLS